MNPALFEQPQVRGAANPLYQFARLQFIAPLEREELANMVRTLGKRTGIRFRDAALIDMLQDEYGGHPLLTRQACSFVHRHRPPEVPYNVAPEELGRAFTATGPATALAHARDLPESFAEWFPDEAARLRVILDDPTAPLPDGSLDHAIAYGLLHEDGRVRISALLRRHRAAV